MENFNKNGFTLAEVLITLGIIGVVAAVTMPLLIQNYQKHVTETKLKKTYSVLSQAFQRAITENGSIDTWGIKDNNLDSTKENIEKILPYLKYVKICPNTEGCWAFPDYYLSKAVHHTQLSITNYAYYIILTDGTFVKFDISGNQINLLIDINGIKAPNTIGKDIFRFIASDFRFSPYSDTDDCKADQRGFACSTIIMQNSWKIPKDYPW